MVVFDVESDGFLDEATKIHVLSYTRDGKKYHSLFDPKQIKDFVENEEILICHNVCGHDLPLLKKLLGVKPKAKIYDTLPMAWVMFPSRKPGLESFGEYYGVPKPPVTDWVGLTREQYQYRCETDVKINWLLWQDLIKRFKLVYGDKKKDLDRYLQYLTFKMQVASSASRRRWRLDKQLAETSLATLLKQEEEKREELISLMPMVPKYKKKTKPKEPFKKDGSLSVHGQNWFNLLESEGLPKGWDKEVLVLDKMVTPNPGSPDQVKAWLTSLGWQPCTFDYKKDSQGKERAIPQVREDGELTPSVKLLIDKDPGVEVLDGLTVILHRKSIFEGFLKNEVGGYVSAEIQGLTNTLRFKHKSPLVNLPGVDKPWGKEIRGCLIADEGQVLCGADMVSLEATTKKHFIHPYDPDYVEEMSQEGFDEHLDLAVKANYLSPDDYQYYIRSTEETTNDVDRYESIHKVRKKFKPVNYSCVYGVGKLKMHRTTGMSIDECDKLITAYWDRNWAVKAFAEDQVVKTVDGQMWVLNPVNKFWYTLRYKKDIFSTINQGTGAYCFDQWCAHYLRHRPDICGQFHDESINGVVVGQEKDHEAVLRKAISDVNDKLKLNVKLDIDVQFGNRYSEIH